VWEPKARSVADPQNRHPHARDGWKSAVFKIAASRARGS
jgi:hypothetical protein